MKIWLLSELFHPVETSTGYFMTKIAEKLSETHPRSINVICGPDCYDSDKLYSSSELKKDIIIHRVKIPSFNKNNLIERSIRMLLLAFKMAFKIFLMVKRGDKVFIVTNPAPLLVLVAIVRRLKFFTLIVLVHDVFPENMLPGKLIKSRSLSFKALSYIFNRAYQQADRIICVGEDMKELMLQKVDFPGNKITVIRNWADCDQIYPLDLKDEDIIKYYRLPELKDKIVIQFAGNIGRVQGLTEFIRVFHKAQNSNLALILIGDGALKKSLSDIIQNENIQNVYFILPRSREEQNEFLNASHIGLVSLNEGMYGLGVPSKSYNIWAAGKPVLFVGDENSEIARNIKDYDIGWAFSWQKGRSLESFLKSLEYSNLHEIRKKGASSRDTALANFDRDFILTQYGNI